MHRLLTATIAALFALLAYLYLFRLETTNTIILALITKVTGL